MAAFHTKCCMGTYPMAPQIVRQVVEVDWSKVNVDYNPIDYTAPVILKQPSFADKLPSDPSFKPAWNSLDQGVDRRSHEGPYPVVDGLPRNPHGRTGVRGRGLLGRWGPNHAADPVVTRWKREKDGRQVKHACSSLPVLQVVLVLRRDGGGWALPGGMVDPGEVVTQTVRREFMEETMNSLAMSAEERQAAVENLEALFQTGEDLYRGYVDDPRNTDNAWMETVAQNFHEDNFEGVLDKLHLHAGDDATAVKWQDVSSELQLYASHSSIVKQAVERRGGHWQ